MQEIQCPIVVWVGDKSLTYVKGVGPGMGRSGKNDVGI